MVRATLRDLSLVLGVIVLMAIVLLVDDRSAAQLRQFGILPRSTGHWWHVLSAPFIHGSYSHLASNAAGLLVFGSLTILRSRWLFLTGSVFIIIMGGSLVWLFGRPALHFGASGWVYGLWALTIAIAWFDRKILSIFVALLVLIFYGGMSYGLLPMEPSVSFEMHIAGGLAGVLCGFLYIQNLKRQRRK